MYIYIYICLYIHMTVSGVRVETRGVVDGEGHDAQLLPLHRLPAQSTLDAN